MTLPSVLRPPAVAGRFYPGDPRVLEAELQLFLRDAPDRSVARRVHGVVAPHAGYMYSGAIAGAAYQAVAVPDLAIVLAPNHTGFGARRSIWPGGRFDLPGGSVPVSAVLVQTLIEETDLEPDMAAHQREHAIEVQLPFLRAKNPRISIAPIVLGHLSLIECKELAAGITRTILRLSGADTKGVLLVASTDMSHYLGAEQARALDALALARIADLDPDGLYRTVTERGISMCGFIPTTVALTAAIGLGATGAEILRYGNSAEASGDYASVVAYAAAVIF